MRPIEVRLERTGLAESRHEVHGVAVSETGEMLGAFGDPGLVAFWRSSMKPFQALPFVRDGGMEDEGFGASQLALACASHHGSSEHVDIVAGMLEAIGLTQDALACGPHRPLDESAARALDEAGRLPGR
ncbi:MAG: asparaginase, partial [Gemmatimonadota bacterium]|nr:asparaginase [Gemmatimonadota bacterium]